MFKGLKFEKSKYPIFKIAFWILIVCSFLMILNIFKLNLYSFSAKPFNYPNKPIALNLTLNKPTDNILFFCFNDFCKMPVNNAIFGINSELSNIYSATFNQKDKDFLKSKVKNIYFAYPLESKDFEKNIENIDIQIGNNIKHFNKSELKKLKNKNIEIILDNSGKKSKYHIYVFENINNYKGFLNHFCNLFLSLFSSWQNFIVPFLWLFVASLIYIFKKDELNLKTNFSNKLFYTILGIIIFFGVLFRLNEINYYSLWFDEIYTKMISSKTLLDTFKDAGNPPMFYIVENIISKISNNDFILKLPSLLLGVLSIPIIYLIFRRIDKNLALLASFMASINPILILVSQEARAYSMCICLNLCIIYFLFEYLKKHNNKTLILFTISSILAINTHYILAIFVLGNILWGLCDLLEKKQKKNIINFIISNFIIILSFVPYLIINLSKSLNPTFNSWIQPITKYTFANIINEYFLNKQIFIIFASIILLMLIFCYLPQKFKNKFHIQINQDKENLFLYLLYSISFILIISSAISIFIKPILYSRALLAIYALLFLLQIIIISTVFNFYNSKNNIIRALKFTYSLFLIFICFTIANPSSPKEKFRFDDFIEFIKYDYPKYEKNYEIHAIFNENKNYLEYFPEIKNLNINWHFIPTNEGKFLSQISKKDFKKSNKKIIVYFNGLTTDFTMTFLKNPTMKIYETNSTKNGKIIFE